MREKCPYLELFWFVFSRIRNNSEYGHFLTQCFVLLVSYFEFYKFKIHKWKYASKWQKTLYYNLSQNVSDHL